MCHGGSYGSKSGLALGNQELTWRAPKDIRNNKELISLKKKKGKDKYSKDKRQDKRQKAKDNKRSQPREASVHCFNLPEKGMELVKDMTTNYTDRQGRKERRC
ncbi:hypothetical protein O181_062506 [Austropuccinia psidii MF-1]|uniref:Uncharacterized protein n=1 Tax=Austropuccinia psidii MF-1 TaxID=1389203 RepID=A0A9Q3HYH3_9BASI|nr:hypothetical protein [Austropuccinia psidii MF-1]